MSAKALHPAAGLADPFKFFEGCELELDRRGSASPTARVPSCSTSIAAAAASVRMRSSSFSSLAVVPALSDAPLVISAVVPVVKGLLGIDGRPMHTGRNQALCTSVRSPSSSPAARVGPADCTALQENACMHMEEDVDGACTPAPPADPEEISLESIGADLFRASVSDAVEQLYPPPDAEPPAPADAEPPDAPPAAAALPPRCSPPVPVPAAPSALAPPSPLACRCGSPARGRVSLADLELLRLLGRGSFAKVFLVRKRDDRRLFAMKVLRKEVVVRRRQVPHTRSERALLEAVRHPFVVELRYAFQTASKLYLVLDYMPGGELFFHLQREYTFSEDVARFYAGEIALALSFLHSLAIVYRDLKPENVLLDGEGHARLTDFGLAKRLEARGAATGTFCGTFEYMAPEVMQRLPYGAPADWWSFGVLLYEMLVGSPPFYSPSRVSMQHRTLCAPLRFPAHVSPAARALLEGLLERDPARRLGARGAADVFDHAWFAGLDWGRLLARAVSPPFRPLPRAHELDVANFAAAFTREPPQDSPASSAALGASQQGLFEGFSCAPPAPAPPPPSPLPADNPTPSSARPASGRRAPPAVG